MKNFIKINLLVILSIITFSCSTENDNIKTENNIKNTKELEVKQQNGLDNVFEDIDLTEMNLRIEDSLVIVSYDSYKDFANKINEISIFCSRTVDENKENISISLSIVVNEAEDTYKAYIGAPVPNFGVYHCPNGYEQVNNCYTQSCVQNTLIDIPEGFGSGDNIMIHHGGIGGVTLCYEDN